MLLERTQGPIGKAVERVVVGSESGEVERKLTTNDEFLEELICDEFVLAGIFLCPIATSREEMCPK